MLQKDRKTKYKLFFSVGKSNNPENKIVELQIPIREKPRSSLGDP